MLGSYSGRAHVGRDVISVLENVLKQYTRPTEDELRTAG